MWLPDGIVADGARGIVGMAVLNLRTGPTASSRSLPAPSRSVPSTCVTAAIVAAPTPVAGAKPIGPDGKTSITTRRPRAGRRHSRAYLPSSKASTRPWPHPFWARRSPGPTARLVPQQARPLPVHPPQRDLIEAVSRRGSPGTTRASPSSGHHGRDVDPGDRRLGGLGDDWSSGGCIPAATVEQRLDGPAVRPD